MNRRASTFMIIFFISLVMLIFYLVSLQNKRASADFTMSQQEKSQLASYTELLKTYEFHALRDAATRAAYESAASGAGAPNGYWISYSSVTKPDLWLAESNISRYAITFANSYLSSISGADFGKVKYEDAGDITSVEILVSRPDLVEENGMASADEGFLVEGKGTSPLVVKSADSGEESQSQNHYKTYVYPLRYWYLYRKIGDWARQNLPSQLSCDFMTTYYGVGSGACPAFVIDEKYVDTIAESSINLLKHSFDSDVECSYNLPCKYAKTEILCAPPVDCGACDIVWPTSGCPIEDIKAKCLSGQDSGAAVCESPSEIPKPPEQPQVELTGVSQQPNQMISCSYSPYGYGEKQTIKFIMNVTCIDKKYQQPVGSSGFENLKFNFLVHVYLTRTTEPPEPECVCPVCEDCNPPPPSTCFPAGTLVLMGDGMQKPIEEIKPGDFVMSYDFEKAANVPAEVLEVESPVRDHMCTLSFDDGSFLMLTDEHPVYTLQGWKSIVPEHTYMEAGIKNVILLNVSKILVGDYVYAVAPAIHSGALQPEPENYFKRIVNISCRRQTIQTYNLKKIDKVSNFYADGVLVHNKEPTPPPTPPEPPTPPPPPPPPPPSPPRPG